MSVSTELLSRCVLCGEPGSRICQICYGDLPNAPERSKTLRHYADVEATARDAAKARAVITELRTELHTILLDLQLLCSQYGHELSHYDSLISRAHKTLLRTLPGGELDLEAMSKTERKSELVACITDMFGVKGRI